jgi:hypothetical protein
MRRGVGSSVPRLLVMVLIRIGCAALRRADCGTERVQPVGRTETLLRRGAEATACRREATGRRRSPAGARISVAAVLRRGGLRCGRLTITPTARLSGRRRSTVPAAVLLRHGGGGGRRRCRSGLGRALLNGRPTRQAELVRGLVLGAAAGANNHRNAPVREHCPGLFPRQAARSIAFRSPSSLVLSRVIWDSTLFSAPFPGRRPQKRERRRGQRSFSS